MARSYESKNIAWNVALPAQPYNAATYVLPIEAIPLILGALEHITIPQRYQGEQPNFEALEVVRAIQYMLMNNANEPIDRIYRLLDTSLNGNTYENAGTEEEPVIVPSIPVVPAPTDAALIPTIKDIQKLIASGVLGSGELASYNPPESIQSLLTRIADGADGLDEEQVADLLELLATIAAAL